MPVRSFAALSSSLSFAYMLIVRSCECRCAEAKWNANIQFRNFNFVFLHQILIYQENIFDRIFSGEKRMAIRMGSIRFCECAYMAFECFCFASIEKRNKKKNLNENIRGGVFNDISLQFSLPMCGWMQTN